MGAVAEPVSEIVKRLRTMSRMLTMGEKIAFGSDAALMDEAAAHIATLEDRVSAIGKERANEKQSEPSEHADLISRLSPRFIHDQALDDAYRMARKAGNHDLAGRLNEFITTNNALKFEAIRALEGRHKDVDR